MLLPKVHMNSTNGMNGGKKRMKTLRELTTRNKKKLSCRRVGLQWLFLETVQNPTTYNFSVEKEMIMSEIRIDCQKYVKPTYFGFTHLFHPTSREIEIIHLFCDMIKKITLLLIKIQNMITLLSLKCQSLFNLYYACSPVHRNACVWAQACWCKNKITFLWFSCLIFRSGWVVVSFLVHVIIRKLC